MITIIAIMAIQINIHMMKMEDIIMIGKTESEDQLIV